LGGTVRSDNPTGADQFCGTGETRTQKEAKLEKAEDGATRRLPQKLKG